MKGRVELNENDQAEGTVGTKATDRERMGCLQRTETRTGGWLTGEEGRER